MADNYNYTLQSCSPSDYPDVPNLCTVDAPSPYDGLVVTITGDPQQRYTVVFNGLNTGVCNGWMPTLIPSAFNNCAALEYDRMYVLFDCATGRRRRRVLLDNSYDQGTVLQFQGECECWRISLSASNFDEQPIVETIYLNCTACLEALNGLTCEEAERTIGYAVRASIPKPEPPNRGFKECCYTNVVLADLSSTDSYKNDFSSVYFKRQTPNDSITYELVGASTGVTALVDGVHGIELAFGNTAQPDLSYFIVEWRKVLIQLGEDQYTIRKTVTIGGVPVVQLSNTYDLKQFSVQRADNTVRIDCNVDGLLVRENVNLKGTGYKNSIRIQGYFGDRQNNFEQNNVVFSDKGGQPYYSQQITISNDYEYTFQAYQIPECISRVLNNEVLMGNELFISDYNKNNHSYLYELLPVELVDDNGAEYPVINRTVNISLTFSDRLKNNRKTNC